MEPATNGKSNSDLPPSYHAIDVADHEDEALSQPKNFAKSKPTTPEKDGADEKMLPKEDLVELKASPIDNQNGEAKLDIGELKTAFVGLTKEELQKYANDPFWVRLRWFLFVTFWILWACMLLGAILIILAAPKCNPPPPRTWWEKGPLTEIDSTISTSQIEKLKELQVTGVIINGPQDVYIDLDETEFIQTLKPYAENNVKVILELEPGHSNIWFSKSENKEESYLDYYIWAPPKAVNGDSPTPPNNWISVKNETAWKYSEKRNEFYYAPKGQPHLNFRNENVTQEFSKVLKKVVRFGVAGVRIKGAPFLIVEEKLSDETHVPNPGGCVLTDYCFYTHSQTEHRNELGPLLKEWRRVVKNITENGPFMVREELANIEAYKVNGSYIVDLPLQSHVFVKPNIDIVGIANAINGTFVANNITWPLWKSKISHEWDVVTYLLPGVPLINLNSSNTKDLLKIRDSASIMRGSVEVHLLNQDSILAFTRVTAGNPGILVALNPSPNRTVVNFPAHIKTVSEDVTVLLLSQNYNETDVRVNVKHEAGNIPISPNSAIVLSYVPQKKDE